MRRAFINTAGQLRAGWRLLIWFLIAAGIQTLIGVVAEWLHVSEEGAFLDPKHLMLGDWVATFVPVMIATLVMMKIERRTLGDYYIPLRGLLGRSFWIGALWGIAAVSLLVGLIAVAGGYRIVGTVLHEHVAYWVVMWLAATATIGIVEEVAFRSYMLRTLADGIGFWPAAFLLAFLFGALHYFSKPHERWEDFASTGLLALFMSLTIARTGSLAWAMGWHFAFDWGAIWLWSGRNAGEYAPGRLVETAWPGSDRVTGGLLGPEASWFAFVVIAVLFGGFHLTYSRKPVPTMSAEGT
ncbi:MAG TPA: CPBP family intramembrane glutamic endopeptidase [Terriglobales bacterium]|nr:CPBP family intramembrane glutamic endopeptidase [Terriglobales bacterium]